MRDLYASITLPVRRLRGFQKVTLQPGGARTVTFEMPVQDLAFVGRDHEPVVEPGSFEVQVDGLTQTFTVQWDCGGPVRPIGLCANRGIRTLNNEEGVAEP